MPKQQIKIAQYDLRTNEKTGVVLVRDAHVFGPVALHKDAGRDGWHLTHLASGLGMYCWTDKKDFKELSAIARRIHADMHPAWTAPEPTNDQKNYMLRFLRPELMPS